ncbi:MAG: radical SAM protein [bacterium]|nr:radical SAM protein [bacterium]
MPRTILEIPESLVEDVKLHGVHPKDVVIYANSLCNLRCKHCYVGNDLLAKRIYYSAESIARFLRTAEPLSRVTVLGGEPFLHPAISRILTAIGEAEISERRVTTNLTRPVRSHTRQLRDYSIRVCVSIDGHEESIHDAIRGPGAFCQTVENLQILLSADVDVEITHTVTNLTIESLPNLIAFCKSLGVKRLNLHKISERGNATTSRHLLLAPERWVDLRQRLRSWARPNGSLLIRYEVTHVTREEFLGLLEAGQYRHHAIGSFYDDEGGQRVVLYPDGKVYLSSEAFGTDSEIGRISNAGFTFNENPQNELTLVQQHGEAFSVSMIDERLQGTSDYPVVLSVSFRESVNV